MPRLITSSSIVSENYSYSFSEELCKNECSIVIGYPELENYFMYVTNGWNKEMKFKFYSDILIRSPNKTFEKLASKGVLKIKV